MSVNTACAKEFESVKLAIEAKGSWKKGEILDRKVIFTDSNKGAAKIRFDIPKEGDYQFYIYVYHNWRKRVPCIFFEGKDSKGDVHKGKVFLEPCWYLRKNTKGRWLMRAVTGLSFWHLPKGLLSLKFWAQARPSIWSNTEMGLEDIIAIETFYLVPVMASSNQRILMQPIDLEFGSGSWEPTAYSGRYGAGFIGTSASPAVSYIDIKVPLSGDYLGAVSVHAQGLYKIEATITLLDKSAEKLTPRNKISKRGRKVYATGIRDADLIKSVLIEGAPDRPLWQSRVFGPFFLESGRYRVMFKPVTSKTPSNPEILIDYFAFIPYVNNP